MPFLDRTTSDRGDLLPIGSAMQGYAGHGRQRQRVHKRQGSGIPLEPLMILQCTRLCKVNPAMPTWDLSPDGEGGDRTGEGVHSWSQSSGAMQYGVPTLISLLPTPCTPTPHNSHPSPYRSMAGVWDTHFWSQSSGAM